MHELWVLELGLSYKETGRSGDQARLSVNLGTEGRGCALQAAETASTDISGGPWPAKKRTLSHRKWTP